MHQGDGQLDIVERLSDIGIALSSEADQQRLLERILLAAKEIIRCDGGTVYSVTADRKLRFEIIRTDSLGIAMGGSTGSPIEFPAVGLELPDGQPNMASVVAQAVLRDVTINIPDAYHAEGFDFSGTRAFDERTGYHSQSFLTVPMKNHEGEIIGVLQLINALGEAGRVLPFADWQQRLAESLASQAATALTRNQLIDELRELFEALIKLIAQAIDDKSPYTGGHCRRVPALTMLLADACSQCAQGPLADFCMSEQERYALHIAGWLHDCGKLTVPDWVMDKATKLDGLYDRIGLIATRFAVLERDAEITYLRGRLAGGDEAKLARVRDETVQSLRTDLAFLRRVNRGGEFMPEQERYRVRAIGSARWCDIDGVDKPVLDDEEQEHLSISKGTLTAHERSIINGHMDATVRMLESLPYPRHLEAVPEYACGHHEKMDGSGYPKGLTREQMSVPARVMGIADVFEALTAADRPYKPAMPVSRALSILGKMADSGHVDPDIHQVFVEQKVWLRYAREFLGPEQLDLE